MPSQDNTVRYKVTGPNRVAGEEPGTILKVDADDVDLNGRHLVNGVRVLLSAAVAGGVLEPQSKAATETATVEPAQQPGASDEQRG